MCEIDKAVVPDAHGSEVDNQPVQVAPAPRYSKNVLVRWPNGLVASSDRPVRRELAQILARCGLIPVIRSTVVDTGVSLFRHEVSIVLCNDWLDDGDYEDILRLRDRSDRKVPVIVVSRTGDWTEYLAAIREGVFDYLAYPQIPGDLQRVIRNALGEGQHLEVA